MEWFKVLLEKARLHSMIGAIAVVALAAKLFILDIWWLVLIFCISFLIIEYLIYLNEIIKKHRFKTQDKVLKERENALKNDAYLNLIWHFFLALSDTNLKLAISIYNIEDKDPL